MLIQNIKPRGGSGSEVIFPEESDSWSISLQNKKCAVVLWSCDVNLRAKW